MSVKVMSWVWDNSPSEGTDRLVLLAIADSCDHDGTNAWPSVSTIADKCRVSERTVQRSIRSLEDAGEIVVERNLGGMVDHRPDRRPNRYRVTMSHPPERGDSGDTACALRGDTGGTNGVTSGVERGDTRVTQPVLDPSIEPSKPPAGAAAPPSTNALIGQWVDNCKRRPPDRVVGQAARRVKHLLDEGFEPALVGRALEAMRSRGKDPSILDSLVNELANAEPSDRFGRPQPMSDGRWTHTAGGVVG